MFAACSPLAQPVSPSRTSFLLPDLVVFAVPAAGVVDDWRDIQPPALVIEILSPRTTTRDRHRKRPAYLAHGAGDVWLVNMDAQHMERWTSRSEFPETQTSSVTWTPSDGSAPLTISLATLFESLPSESPRNPH